MRFFIFGLAIMALTHKPCHGVDERFWRKLILGESEKSSSLPQAPALSSFVMTSPTYLYDLNGDRQMERIIIGKKDGLDTLEIYDQAKNRLFYGELLPTGLESKILKLRLVALSESSRALLIYYDEGKTESKFFESQARLYLIGFEINNLNNMKLVKGPAFWHEYQAFREQYWQRHHAINLIDVDGDGKKEVFVNYKHEQSIWKYSKNGNWLKL
jgi:hypothetical protein